MKRTEGLYQEPLLMSWHDYVNALVAYGKTRKEAEEMATKLYVKQYGRTPEEHRAKLDSDPYLWGFSKTVKIKV